MAGLAVAGAPLGYYLGEGAEGAARDHHVKRHCTRVLSSPGTIGRRRARAHRFTHPTPFHTQTQKNHIQNTKNQIKKNKTNNTGWRYHLRRPSAWFGVFALGTAAVAHGMQQSAARLMGVIPNDAEVERHLETRPGK